MSRTDKISGQAGIMTKLSDEGDCCILCQNIFGNMKIEEYVYNRILLLVM